MDDAEVKPDASCKPASVEPDPMKVPIPEMLRNYTVSMQANTAYDSPFQVRIWTEDEKGRLVPLEPVLKYLNYGTASFAQDLLGVKCADGLVGRGFKENGQLISPLADKLPFPEFQNFVLKQGAKELVEFTCERE
jgi:hypothetical protein